MQHNRTMQVSMAGTRKTKHWPKAEILWSEFVDRLKQPVRSTETMEEYLSFPKAKQDELKDVGGFVGGTFANDIRKAAYVTGRDLLTLDMDQIPAGGTDAILKRVAGLGCAAVVYSTRKHEFMIEVSGERIDDEWYNTKVNGVSGASNYYQAKFKTALDKFNNDPVNVESGVAPMREIEGDLTSKLVTFK